MTIYVGNLPLPVEREDLIHLFGQFGEVRICNLPEDPETGRRRGFAFVDMKDANSEDVAICNLQDTQFMGRMILVQKATPEQLKKERGQRPRW